MFAPLLVYPRAEPCDLCGCREFELVADRDRRGGRLPTVICRVCGLLAHARVPTESELQEYYARQYRWDYQGEYLPAPYRVVREWKRGKRLRRELTPYLRRGDRIIEIGCGLGCTVKNLELAGFDAQGIEPAAGFRQFACQALRARVAPGYLGTLPPRSEYDFVLLVHVLEHLRSPSQSLAHIRSLLRPGGRLYVEVPNAGAPHAAPGKMFHFAHIYNFTADSLEMAAGKAGFRIDYWLSAPQARNLRAVLSCGNPGQWSVRPSSYARTMNAVRRYNLISYHLRPRYVCERLRTAISHAWDHLCGTLRAKRIVRGCQGIAEPPERRLCSRNSAII
jgi:SAM-dependent methyltransferase